MLRTKTNEFATATVLEDRLVEIKIHHGTILNRDLMRQGYKELAELTQTPYALLIDRTSSDYSMNFDAIPEGGNHPLIIAQAYLIPPYDTGKKLNVDTIMDYPRKADTPTRVFVNRENAIKWLREQRDMA